MPLAQPYHRAHLRKTLLDAAVALIGEVGPRAFTLREVARRAGVSHNAPYRHFASRDELLTAVAAEGFDRLTATMQRRIARGKTPLERLQLGGCGYVDFALRWPQHFVVMFDLPRCPRGNADGLPSPPSPSQPGPEESVAGIGGNAFQVLLDCVGAAQAAGDLPPGDLLPLAWTAWALVHGISKLAISGNLPLSPRATLQFTRRATQAIFSAKITSQKVRK